MSTTTHDARCPACGRMKPGPRPRTSKRWSGRKLAAARIRARLSISALAEKIGVDRKTVTRWEDNVVPSEKAVAKLRKVLKATLPR